ncbi:hypothetical protein Tco_0762325, partial [Tanacetum coccineum]
VDDDDIDTESDGDTDTSSDEYKTFLSGDLKKRTIQKVEEVVDELKKLKSMSCVRGFRALYARVEEEVVKKPISEVKVTNCILGLRARNAPDVRCSKHETRSVNLSVGVQFFVLQMDNSDDYRILLADIDVEMMMLEVVSNVTWIHGWGDEMDEKQNEVDWQEDSYHGVDEVEDLFVEFDQAIEDALLQKMIYKTLADLVDQQDDEKVDQERLRKRIRLN